MHSKIIQIESAPVALSERISPDYYYDHWFLSSVADYVDVDEENSVDELIQLFKSVCGNEIEAFTDENGVGLIFKDGFVRTFMEREYQQYEYPVLYGDCNTPLLSEAECFQLSCAAAREVETNAGIGRNTASKGF